MMIVAFLEKYGLRLYSNRFLLAITLRYIHIQLPQFLVFTQFPLIFVIVVSASIFYRLAFYRLLLLSILRPSSVPVTVGFFLHNLKR